MGAKISTQGSHRVMQSSNVMGAEQELKSPPKQQLCESKTWQNFRACQYTATNTKIKDSEYKSCDFGSIQSATNPSLLIKVLETNMLCPCTTLKTVR